jgi:hypothetical protein
LNRFGEKIDAKAFGEPHRVVYVAARERKKKLVETCAPDDIVASQEERRSLNDVAQCFITDGRSESAVQLVKFNNTKGDKAQRGLHALCAIGFAKQL